MQNKNILLPVLALPPRGQRKSVFWAILAVEAIAALSLIIFHNINIQNAARWLLAVSPDAFAAQNQRILLDILTVVFSTLHAELFMLLTIFSARTVLVLKIASKDRTEGKRWYLHLVKPKSLGWFFLTILSYYLLLWLGWAALFIPLLIFVFLFFSWPIAFAAGHTARWLPLRVSLNKTAARWKKLIIPFLLILLSQLAFFAGAWFALTEMAMITPITGFPMLLLCLVGAEISYLLWAGFFTRAVKDTPNQTFVFPKWVAVISTIGLVITSVWLFTVSKVILALNSDPVGRSILIYDILPQAETTTLLNWQKQLQNQKAQESLTPEQSAHLDELIDQVSLEYANQASLSGEFNSETLEQIAPEN